MRNTLLLIHIVAATASVLSIPSVTLYASEHKIALRIAMYSLATLLLSGLILVPSSPTSLSVVCIQFGLIAASVAIGYLYNTRIRQNKTEKNN